MNKTTEQGPATREELIAVLEGWKQYWQSRGAWRPSSDPARASLYRLQDTTDRILDREPQEIEDCAACGSECDIRGEKVVFIRCLGMSTTCGYSGPLWATKTQAIATHNATQRAMKEVKEQWAKSSNS